MWYSLNEINYRTESTSGISQWYIQSCLSQFRSETLHAQIALRLCQALQAALESEVISQTAHSDIIRPLCEETYMYLAHLLDYDSPLQLTVGNQCKSDDGLTFNFPAAVSIFNDLVLSYNVSIEHCLHANYSDSDVISLSAHSSRNCSFFLDP